MKTSVVALLVTLSSLATGCGIFNRDGLVKEQREAIVVAQNSCGVSKVADGTLVFSAAPVLNDKEEADINSTAKVANLGDAQVLRSIWQQRICLLAALDRSLAPKIGKWRSEVGTAIDNWPVFEADQYAQQIVELKKARSDQLEHIRKTYGSNPGQNRISFAMLNAAIPYYDFLHIRKVDFGIVANDDAKIKNLKIRGSSAKVCLSKDEFSPAVRPGLDQTRNVAMGIGLGNMSDDQALELMVSTVYEVGVQRLLAAKEASGTIGAAASCSASKTKSATQPAGNDKPVEKKADDKKLQEKEVSGKTPENTAKPDDKKKDDKREGEKTTGILGMLEPHKLLSLPVSRPLLLSLITRPLKHMRVL